MITYRKPSPEDIVTGLIGSLNFNLTVSLSTIRNGSTRNAGLNDTSKGSPEYSISSSSLPSPTSLLAPEITRGSEDFGWFLKDCPGAEFVVAAGDGPSLHTAGFDFDDRLIGTMCDVYFAILEQ